MRITSVDTYLVGNPWKNWLFTRVHTDEGIYGVGEGTLNGFSATVEAAVRELADQYVGLDPHDVELLRQRMVRDVYTDGGQIHMAAVAAIEVGCWDIVGKASGQPVHRLLGGRVRDRVRVYANGWYKVPRDPDAFAEAAADVAARGFTAMKFDPFGPAHLVMDAGEMRLALELVSAVREAVGPEVDLMIEGHCRFSVGTALRIANRLAEFGVCWFEEPISHRNISAMADVIARSPVPIATGESFTSIEQFAELCGSHGLAVAQPEPLFLGGFLPTRQVASLAQGNGIVVAPHNAQSPVCTAISLHLGASTPNFYVQEFFDEFNDEWAVNLVDHQFEVEAGHLAVNDRPGLGVDLNWDWLEAHPYQSANRLSLFEQGWELRADKEG